MEKSRATKEVVEELIDFKNHLTNMLNEYERSHKSYYYPTPENMIAELDSRIDRYNDELYLSNKK